ncbi:Hypothetical protein PHPALM_14448 [Phytophthora palmivora]|uniref:Uncharacterized protein n=1 Tax=Phytophthora palmivora TaxID=4796 RepID=A0A2P4XUX2_9STRA|nr:Hypothetical protein PHPALM_14448 [Phytophthora palmivora]
MATAPNAGPGGSKGCRRLSRSRWKRLSDLRGRHTLRSFRQPRKRSGLRRRPRRPFTTTLTKCRGTESLSPSRRLSRVSPVWMSPIRRLCEAPMWKSPGWRVEFRTPHRPFKMCRWK